MKIAYVGNFTQTHCTEVHLAATLESLGHQVYRRQENELMRDWVLNLPDGVDLVLYTRTWGEFVTLADLQSLKELHIPTASYHLDLYVGLKREDGLDNDPFWRTDFVFTPDGDPVSAEVFKANGVKHYYQKAGVYKAECFMNYPSKLTGASLMPDGTIDLDLERSIDVLFVGGGDKVGSPHGYGHKKEWPYRDALITWLYDTYGDQFSKFGYPQPTIRNKELNQLYANTKVVVGDSVCIDFSHENYWSDRVYETLGRGGFLIHPYIKGMEEEFISGEHLVFYDYGDFKQLKSLIDYYISHDDERERIRKTGHEFVKNNCTYTERLKQMLEVVNAKN